MARADIFIDGSNFTIAARDLIHGYVDVKALARLLVRRADHAPGAIFYYDSPSPNRSVQAGQQQFWERLRAARIEVRLGRREPNHDGTHREKECDVMLAVDMVSRACDKLYDRAILVTGDTDLAVAVEEVQRRGIEVGWAYLPTQQHIDRLRQLIPEAMRIELDEKVLRTLRQQRSR